MEFESARQEGSIQSSPHSILLDTWWANWVFFVQLLITNLLVFSGFLISVRHTVRVAIPQLIRNASPRSV
jgi:hypothetical protein